MQNYVNFTGKFVHFILKWDWFWIRRIVNKHFKWQKAQTCWFGLLEFGAGNEIRTRDPDLGKVVLYQLSYSRMSAFAVWVRII